METTPDKGPIRFLEKHLTKHDKNIYLELIPILYPNIDKWIANEKIDNALSNKILDKQKHNRLPKNMPSKTKTWPIYGECQEATVLWQISLPVNHMPHM